MNCFLVVYRRTHSYMALNLETLRSRAKNPCLDKGTLRNDSCCLSAKANYCKCWPGAMDQNSAPMLATQVPTRSRSCRNMFTWAELVDGRRQEEIQVITHIRNACVYMYAS